MNNSVPLLQVMGLTMDFGGLRAVDQLDLHVDAGEIVALIGPNGAGKTTFFNCITGLCTPTAGVVTMTSPGRAPQAIHGLKPNQITEKGVARTFQNIRLFGSMTALENVMIGHHCRTAAGIVGAVFRGRKTVAEEQRVVEQSYALLQRVNIAEYVNEPADNLPYGVQRRLEIARALATDPLLLLLDEPAAGMNPQETNELDELIVRIRDEYHIAVLLIEHDMKLVMSLSDRIEVMDSGRKIAQGTPEVIRQDPLVIKAYLGENVIA